MVKAHSTSRRRFYRHPSLSHPPKPPSTAASLLLNFPFESHRRCDVPGGDQSFSCSHFLRVFVSVSFERCARPCPISCQIESSNFPPYFTLEATTGEGGAKDDDRARAILLSVSGAPLLDDRTPWQVFVQVGEEFLCRSRAIGELQLLHVAQLDETGQSARGQQWTAWKRARVRIRISILNWDTICSSGWDCKRGTVHIPASERT